MKKRIFLDVQWKLHSSYRVVIDFPPEGYKFITSTRLDTTLQRMSRVQTSYKLFRLLSKRIPLTLLKAYLDKYLKKPPEGTVLTYATEHLVFRKEPWIVDIGDVMNFVGGDFRNFGLYRRIIEKALSSTNCKRILCFSNVAKKSLLYNLDRKGFKHKIEVIPLAVYPSNFKKQYDKAKIKILFVNSANIRGEFEEKGGREVLEVFSALCRKYNNLELVIRSDVPKHIKKKCEKNRNVHIIDTIIPREHLEQEFKSADIFLFPSYLTPNMTIIEAMSYELPVITIDFYANSELVEDGRTGFVVDAPIRVPQSWGNVLSIGSSMRTRCTITRSKMIQELTEKVSLLIEDEKLRKRMGKEARWEVEYGNFSLLKRNKKLKKIFDEATESC